MLQNDRNPQDNFDPFGQEPSTPPTQEPFAQEDYTTEQGPDDEHKGEEKQNPLYGPDFFTQRGGNDGGYNPYGGGAFYGNSSGGSDGSSSQGGGSYFGSDYFQNRGSFTQDTPPTPSPKKPKNTLAIVGMSLGIASLVFSTICCCGFGFGLGLPLGIAGLIVSILAQKKESSGQGIAGIITAALGLLFSLLFLILLLSGNVDYTFMDGSNENINDLTRLLSFYIH